MFILSFTSSFLLLFLFFITLFSIGLTFFILGLILKKTKQWVPGMILCILTFFFSTFWFISIIKKIPDNFKFHKEYYLYNSNENDSLHDCDDEEFNDDEDKERIDNKQVQDIPQITGFIQDTDKSLIFIKIYPDKTLQDYGITVNKIDTYNTSANSTNKVIPLNISFNNKFKGQLQLILFTSDNIELGKSYVEINQNENSTFTIKFSFEPDVNFLKIDHARIKTSD